MREYIIKQLHSRVMNEDGTANLEYPQWKRRVWTVGAFAALRVHTVLAITTIPLFVVVILAMKMAEMLKEIGEATVATVAAQGRNLIKDVRGCRNIWKGEYGRGKLIVRNPTAAPTPLED